MSDHTYEVWLVCYLHALRPQILDVVQASCDLEHLSDALCTINALLELAQRLQVCVAVWFLIDSFQGKLQSFSAITANVDL